MKEVDNPNLNGEVFQRSTLLTSKIRGELCIVRMMMMMRKHFRCYRGYRTILMRYARDLNRWQENIRILR
jgi:hypothetical protein